MSNHPHAKGSTQQAGSHVHNHNHSHSGPPATGRNPEAAPSLFIGFIEGVIEQVCDRLDSGLRVVPACPGGPGLRLPAAGGADVGGGSAVPPPGEPAAQDEPEVIRDCAKVQLRLNELQADIERQPGYRVQ